MEISSQDPNIALQQFNTQINQIEENKKGPSNGSVIFWLLLFPPVAFYKMWKNKKFHAWFPNLMIILAVLNFPSLLAMNTSVSPDTLNAYKSLGLNYTPISTAPYFISTIILSLINIIAGIYFRRKAKTESSLSGFSIISCIFLMLVQYVPITIWTTNTINGVFSQIPQLNQLGY